MLPRIIGLVALFSTLAAPVRAQELIEGLQSWSDATVGLSTQKWVGPRVPFPDPTPRPVSTGRIDSQFLPLSVHVTAGVDGTRAAATLAALERMYLVLDAAGWIQARGDAGQGGTGGHDLYIVANAQHGAASALDASEPVSPYDGARAHALLDARVPGRNLEVCTAQALMDALLYELDPAEAPSVRHGSAAYVAWLASGVFGCDDDGERALDLDDLQHDPLRDPESHASMLLFARLSERQDQQRGTFLRDMWDFARQRTWEGKDLRASPDLFECFDQAFEHGKEKLENVLGELAESREFTPFPLGVLGTDEKLRAVHWDKLPSYVSPVDPVVEQLGTVFLRVALEKPRLGDRLRIWARGELGARWALTATRLDAQGKSQGSVHAPPRKNPNSFVVVELDDRTTDVLVSVTNLGDGVPDPDVSSEVFDHGVQLVVASGGPPVMPGETVDPP